MDTPLPSNETLIAYGNDVPWQDVERKRRQFNSVFTKYTKDKLDLDGLSHAVGTQVEAICDPDDLASGNVLIARENGHAFVLGSTVSQRYRGDHTFDESIVPYNLNPSVNQTNIHQTEDPTTLLRVLGAEIELGVMLGDGASPNETQMQEYIEAYARHAQRLGVYPKLDREACQYQVEAHIAPSIGYPKTRTALNGMMTALALASAETGMLTAILSCYPTESDFKMTDHPKVQTAVDLMLEVNDFFPQYQQNLRDVKARYHVEYPGTHYVNMFRNQGCHIHIDLAGRSEALGLLTFYTILRSATALANSALLKGCPFVNGTCDPELLCAREYLRSTTVTGRYLQLPISPHFSAEGLQQYASLLKLERANSVGRALLYHDHLGTPVSLMHNPVGRVRPDLATSKRVTTVESTGMPTNVSASRMAAVLTDFEFSHAVIENYFRKHGCDLGPMYDDKVMWAVLGPLSEESIQKQSDASDRLCSDATVITATGEEMTLADFYQLKRKFMHRALVDLDEVAPRDIDDVYMSFARMLEPLSGQAAQTVHQYICDSKRRSTGNWGMILRNAFIEAGGVLGDHCPDAVLTVVRQINSALQERYTDA
jgi:hypothetical protein